MESPGKGRYPLTVVVPVFEGSYVIERYVYIGPKNGRGVQWLVHRIEEDGLHLQRTCMTLGLAADYVRNLAP